MYRYKFELTEKQEEILADWLAEQYKEHIEEQRRTMSEKDFAMLTLDGQYPYTGAIGGGITYHFTPTSMGVIAVVTYSDKKIDLTEYDMW